jgi:hypothetical protein
MDQGKVWMVLVGCLIWSGGQGSESGLRFQAGLDGARVSPSPVLTSAWGSAFFSFAPDFSRVAYRLKLRGGTRLTAARLRCGLTGNTGPVIAELLPPVSGGWSGSLNLTAVLTAANLNGGMDCAAAIGQTIADLADLASAMANGRTYVDVISAAFPEGEIRGQVQTFVPPVASSTPITTIPAARISVVSTPLPTAAFPSSGIIPITMETAFPASIYGRSTVLIPGQIINVPVSFLGAPTTALTSSQLAVTIPDLSLSVPASSFALPPASFTVPSSFNPPALPTGFNPPFPATTIAIPATAVSIPATVRTFAPSSVIAATATVSIPATSFPPGTAFPGNLTLTLTLSTGAAF